jgi:hypothetical protein
LQFYYGDPMKPNPPVTNIFMISFFVQTRCIASYRL